MCSDASYLYSGYSTYTKEVLTRLYKNPKLHIAEFASYATIGDERDRSIPWRFYPNAVKPSDSRHEEYESQTKNTFGAWRFERVLLDFQPDVVFDIRDYWMSAYQADSPLRPYFHWAIMPTVDSAPQRDEWIETFIDADAVFTYSDWGLNILREQSQNRINLQQPAYPGVDLNIFKPVADKKAHRAALGFKDDVFIIGTVMRNQKRKLYPDLFAAFRKFLDTAPPELASKTFLYVHTSYPDVGWNIPELLKEFNLGSKVLFTYICKVTNRPYFTFFQDAKTYSPYSNAPTGTLPSVSAGLTVEQMAEVFNIFDVYIQYAICEGFGMPQAEAAACGVPVMAVDYSAMADVVEKTKGIPLKVQRMFRELETNAYRALPDNDYCATAIEKFFTAPESYRKQKSEQARKAAETYFNWDRTAKIWGDYFESFEPTGLQGQWDAKVPIHNIPNSTPENISNPEFVEWIFKAVLNEPDKISSLHALNTLRDLNYGVVPRGRNMEPVNRKKVFSAYTKLAVNKINAEQARMGMVKMPLHDYIDYANKKERAR